MFIYICFIYRQMILQTIQCHCITGRSRTTYTFVGNNTKELTWQALETHGPKWSERATKGPKGF